ncbi:ArsR family transcriptional regulator [Halobacteriales archaeon QS_8_69_26]|nr:MAG: ArsR family transcriptional regulator [Halobacteriales archaeon QS_8_69_26]
MADPLSGFDRSGSDDADPRVVGLDSEDADELMDALSAATAREVLSALHRDPANPSEVADRVDTSLQNAQYHLGNLEDAGVVEVVDTTYSEKGREMDVYAPADDSLVVFAGDEEDAGGLRNALARFLGGLGLLAAASLVVQRVVAGEWLPSDGGGGGGPTVTDAGTATEGAAGLPPGALFFLGGATVLLVSFAVQYLRTR